MVYRVKGSGKVQQTKSRHLTFVGCKQKVVVYFSYCCLGAVVWVQL